jgi:AcrR family transcriptional regulator
MSEPYEVDSGGQRRGPGAAPTTACRRRGRPRDERVDAAVCAAVRELLVESGYANTTMQEIARRSGASLPAIYRRWPSKAELVQHAVLLGTERRPIDPDGNFFEELDRYIDGVLAVLCDEVTVAALPGLLMDLRGDAGLRERYYEVFSAQMTPFAKLVGAAMERGIVPAGLGPERLSLVISGTALGWALNSAGAPGCELKHLISDIVCRAIRAGP